MLSIPFASAQKGNLFITSYDLEKVLDKQVFSICEDSYQNMLFATRKGILFFDSEGWEVIGTPDIPLVVQKDQTGSRIFVGCRNGCGYLEKQPEGQYNYYSLLADSIKPGDITGIEQTSSQVYFYSKAGVIRVNKMYSDEQEFIFPDPGSYYNGIVSLGEDIYLNVFPSGLISANDSGITFAAGQSFIGQEQILFSIPFNDNNVMIGTGNSGLYLFDGSTLTPYKIENQAYLNESYLVDGISLDKNSFVVSTILGGCLMIDKTTGKTLYTINNQTGLPDDEIYALGFDSNKGIWLSHTYGLSRVDPFIPVKNYNTYPGMNGYLFSSTVFNNNLYVSTYNGVYKLAEKKQFIEKEIMVKVPKEKPAPIAKEKTIQPEVQAGPVEQVEAPAEEQPALSAKDQRKLKRQQKKESRQADTTGGQTAKKDITSFFSSIVKSLDTKTSAVAQTPLEKKAEIKQDAFKKKKIYSLQSISHEFVKIEGLNEKGKPLLNFRDRIVVGTHAGLYEIVNDKARKVFDDWYIEFLYLSPVTDRLYAGTYKKVYLLDLVDNKWVILKKFDEIEEDIFSICEISEDLVWFGGYQNAYRINMSGNSISEIKSYQYTTQDFEPTFIKRNVDDLLFIRASGTYILSNDSLVPFTDDQLLMENIPVNHYTDAELSWILQNNEWIKFGGGADSAGLATNSYLNLFNDIQDIYFDQDGNIWVIHENTLIDKIVVRDMAAFSQVFGLQVQQISNENGFRYAVGDLDISYRDRSLNFDISAPSFLKAFSTEYQYIIDGLTHEWSEWSENSIISFPVIPPRSYTMRIQARNILGQLSNESSIAFSIKSPFWSSWWFILFMVICLIGLVYVIIRLRVQKLERDKRILEQKVRERTAEIERQKNEIAAQQKEIMDSIHYAQRIQRAVLPKHEKISELLPENFILYMPRDIVSGDFYWMKSIGDLVIFAAADCTGHGVPGAFMSMLGVSFLNEIVSRDEKFTASFILQRLRDLVKTTLSQTGKEGEAKDGMDIALIIYDKKKRKCQYAGAYNPLYLIRNSELSEVKADRMPIGIYQADEKEFTNNELHLQKGDCLYIFSDGFSDQIGGDKGKKFLSKTMKDLLVQIHAEPMSKQKDILQKTLSDWMGSFSQVDDVMVAGLRIS